MGVSNNNIDVYNTTGQLEPQFTWHVGFNSLASIDTNLRFRLTIRPVTDFQSLSRIPNPAVLYEQTGIVLDGTNNVGNFTFTLPLNISSSGGPYRDYQVVIEAHDGNGNTSAGNIVGTSNENGWTAYPNGYDIIAVNNPRYSGFEASLQIPTEQYLGSGFITMTGSHSTYQYTTSDGYMSIEFYSGVLDPNIVGGFLYVSSGRFPKYESLIRSGLWKTGVLRTRFDNFDAINKRAFAQNAALNVRNNPYAYASVSFYDKLDQALLNAGVDISTGLYLSDNFIVFNNSYFNSSQGASKIYMKRVSGVATGLSDPMITGVLMEGEIPMSYTVVGPNTNIAYFTETYFNNYNGTYTGGIQGLPDTSVVGLASGIQVVAMTMTFQQSDSRYFANQAISYVDYLGSHQLYPFVEGVGFHDLKASGDVYLPGAPMTGGNFITIGLQDPSGYNLSIVSTLSTTFANGLSSIKRNYITLDGTNEFDYDIPLDARSAKNSSSILISDVMEVQKYPIL